MSRFSKKYLSIRTQFNAFLEEHPLFLIGWVVSLCILFYFNGLRFYWAFVFLIALSQWAKIWKVILPVFCLSWIFLAFWLGGTDIENPIEGRARVSIYEKKLSQSAFGTAWVLKGFIQQFQAEGVRKMRHMPFSAYIPKETLIPRLDKEYWVNCQLQKSDFYGFRLKVKKGAQFVGINKTTSLAEFRYHIKEAFKKFLKKRIPYPKARLFLIGMSTGDFDDSFLSFTFSRFGLNHLLAISGFHFGILALFIGFLLKKFPFKVRIVFLGLLLTLFYLFVGYSPSLQRAWLVALIYLFGSYKKEMMTTINVLSLALCICLIYNPYMLFNMGFQFSFAITYAILIYYKPIFLHLKQWTLPKNKVDQFVVQFLALGIAVHLAAIPISLYHFHKFYFLGFLFNLFVPALVGLLLVGFMSALLIYPLFHFLSEKLLNWVGFLAEQLLRFIFWIPTSVDYCVRTSLISSSFVIFYFSLFFIFATLFEAERKEIFIDYALN